VRGGSAMIKIHL